MIDTDYKFGQTYVLADQIKTADEHPQFQRIFETPNGGVILLGMKAGQALAEHVAPAEVMVNMIEGAIEFTMIDMPHTISAGEFFLIGKGVPHSVVAKADSKIMLVKIKP